MIQKRDRRAAMNALRCLALAGLTCAAAAAADERSDNALKSPSQQRLGVIVPAHRGDLDRAVSSLGRWPAKCSPVTQKNVDIVLYYAEGEEDTAAAAAMPKIVDSAGRCFADTRLVYANLSEEVRIGRAESRFISMFYCSVVYFLAGLQGFVDGDRIIRDDAFSNTTAMMLVVGSSPRNVDRRKRL